MKRLTIAVGIATALAFLSPLTRGTGAQPKKVREMYVILKARLFEVDETFHRKLARIGRLSREDLEDLERKALTPQKDKQPAESLFALLEKQIPILNGKEVDLDPGQESLLLDWSKKHNLLPAPEQLRKGQQGPQTIQEGLSLRARVQISPDRRFVRVTFTEKSVELEGTDKVNVPLAGKGKEVVGELAFLKEGGLSQVRDIPDGGIFLLPLQHRPRTARENDRWLVAQVEPRIIIEEEERVRRAQAPRPKGPMPLFFLVTAVNKDSLVLEPAPMPTKEVHPDKVEYRVAFRGMTAMDPKGKKLTPEEVARRVKPGSVVLVNVDESPVGPAYLAVLRDDAVVLSGVVPPSRGEGIKPEK